MVEKEGWSVLIFFFSAVRLKIRYKHVFRSVAFQRNGHGRPMIVTLVVFMVGECRSCI